MNKTTQLKLTILIFLAVCPLGWGQGTEVVLPPAKDNTIFSEAAESNGQGIYLFVGRTNEPSIRRALLKFDLSGVIPNGAVIESASLNLSMNRTIVGNQTITVHRLLRDWGEGPSNAFGQEGRGAPAETGDATWVNAFHPSDAWSSQGGDFEAVASASQSVGANGIYSWGGSTIRPRTMAGSSSGRNQQPAPSALPAGNSPPRRTGRR